MEECNLAATFKNNRPGGCGGRTPGTTYTIEQPPRTVRCAASLARAVSPGPFRGGLLDTSSCHSKHGPGKELTWEVNNQVIALTSLPFRYIMHTAANKGLWVRTIGS